MFLRRRSQRVRRTESDTALVQAEQESRHDSAIEQLKDELKHKVDGMKGQEKSKEVRVCVPELLHIAEIICSQTATSTRRVDFCSRSGSWVGIRLKFMAPSWCSPFEKVALGFCDAIRRFFRVSASLD